MILTQAHPLEPVTRDEAVPDEAQRRLAELTDAVAARDNFIAVAAHELRNPMTPIIGQIELLLKGVRAGKYAPNQIETRLERIHRSMGHYLKRAATLLDVSRITSGKFKMVPAPCDLGEVIRLVADTFDETARHAGASLEIDAPQTLLGSWDRLALEQIIDNLVSNAIKYGGGSPVLISVAEPKNASNVVIVVQDHGPGISPRNKERIFGQFERAIGADERQTGFGVGLWVVGKIVEAMEGTIAVNDAQGGGTIFEVVLPRYSETDRHD
jgi:two-component system OmpR family sensor kinase